MKVSSPFKFLLFFLVLSLFLILSSFITYGLIKIKSFEKEEQKARKISQVQTTPAPSPQISPEQVASYPALIKEAAGFSLLAPVEKKYLKNALLDKENPQVISFFLEPGTPIKAVFSGKVTKVFHEQKPFPNDLPFEEIRLEGLEGGYWASYVLVGKVLVKEGNIALEGAILGMAGEGGLGFRSGTNLSLWIHQKDGNFVKLTKEMFR
jgi:hypothetical protein